MSSTPLRPLDNYIKDRLTFYITEISEILNADTVLIIGPILPGLELSLRHAIDLIHDKKESVAIILDTLGGVTEVVEQMVTVLRYAYRDLTVIIPDRAMSAGTIFTLSADRIMMDHLSNLGPIDPQIERDGKLVPALSYLNQFDRLNNKAKGGALTAAEYALLSKLDLGELYQFEQARELSIELLEKWLPRYKFKNWNETETTKRKIFIKDREKRAKEIASLLNDTERWHSHRRAIDRETLQEEVRLKIDNLEDNIQLYQLIRDYFSLLKDYMHREKFSSFIHTKEYF